ncbi:hypothetical protein ACTXT7_000444 [Hymenolepis weldensis]
MVKFARMHLSKIKDVITCAGFHQNFGLNFTRFYRREYTENTPLGLCHYLCFALHNHLSTPY